MPKKTERMNLQMSPKVREALEHLGEQTDASLSEVVRRSLAVYQTLIKETQSGGKVIVRHGDHEKEVLLIP